MTEKIRTLFIFEILGKPAEHIKGSLNKMIDQLGEQKGVEIIRRDVHEPKLVENDGNSESKLEQLEKENYVKQGLYSTFAEVEIYTDNVILIMSIVLNMLPAHVEILQPGDFVMKNTDISGLMTELGVKMHKYDEVTKVLMMEKEHLIGRLNEAEAKVRNFEGEIKGVVEETKKEEERKEEEVEDKIEEKIEKVNEVDIGVEKEKDKAPI